MHCCLNSVASGSPGVLSGWNVGVGRSQWFGQGSHDVGSGAGSHLLPDLRSSSHSSGARNHLFQPGPRRCWRLDCEGWSHWREVSECGCETPPPPSPKMTMILFLNDAAGQYVCLHGTFGKVFFSPIALIYDCVCVWMYVCVCACAYVHVCVCSCVCVCASPCVHSCCMHWILKMCV